jgi:hypothetical protein
MRFQFYSLTLLSTAFLGEKGGGGERERERELVVTILYQLIAVEVYQNLG